MLCNKKVNEKNNCNFIKKNIEISTNLRDVKIKLI